MGVKVSERLHCAPTEWQIADITMLEGAYVAMLEGAYVAEVEGRAQEDRFGERALEIREAQAEAGVVVDIVLVEPWCPDLKGSY
jgi:hypothetical protein